MFTPPTLRVVTANGGGHYPDRVHVVVVGAGPAGLMAAEVAAANGHDVAVFDQHRSPARKFVVAGRGGLNITHSEPLEMFLDRYGPERVRLESAIRSFTPDDLQGWCAGLGHPTFVGSSGRVFPEEFRAVPLLRSWLQRLARAGVMFHPQHRWTGWDGDGALLFDRDGEPVSFAADRTILALGGASWPRVSSDGSWAALLADHGVEVRPLRAANCGVRVPWSEVMVDKFAGVPVKNAAVVVDGVTVRGDPIITASGLEGGPIYGHSRRIRAQLDAEGAAVAIDLFPDLDVAALRARLVQSRSRGQSIAKWMRKAGVTAVGASLMREATGNQLPIEPNELAHLAKSVPVAVAAMADIDRAISSSGGVAWSEVDETFQLRAMPGVQVVGEMLDWDAPTGGYLLQACFSTAHLAAATMART